MGFPLIHSHILQNGVGDLGTLLLGNGSVPLRLAVIVPNLRDNRGRSRSVLLADDVSESEELLVHHPIGPVDVGRILRTFKIKKNVEVTDNGKIII